MRRKEKTAAYHLLTAHKCSDLEKLHPFASVDGNGHVRELRSRDKLWALRLTSVETVMLPSLPPEILDLIVDNLHDQLVTLKACCLVSKSWVPRSRSHIFAHIELSLRFIRSWMKAFPDPSNTPIHHTRNLHLRIRNLGVLPIKVCARICSFRRIQELSVSNFGWGELHSVSFVQLRGLSPTLKSLHLSTSAGTPISDIVYLICSFPSLKDLSLHSVRESDTDVWAAPPTSPNFTGFLLLKGENRFITRRLLELPDGLHFSKICVRGRVEDINPGTVMDLVLKCSGTLETLYLKYHSSGAPLVSMVSQSLTLRLVTSMTPSPLDLSDATKLRV